MCLGDNAALVVSGRIDVQVTSGPQSPFDTHGVAPSVRAIARAGISVCLSSFQSCIFQLGQPCRQSLD